MIIATAASAKVCGISLALQTFQLADSNFKRKQVLMLWLVSIFTAQLRNRFINVHRSVKIAKRKIHENGLHKKNIIKI